MMMWLRRLWIQLTADRKRFGILCSVSVLGLLLWARLIVISDMPRQAIADDPPSADAATAPDQASSMRPGKRMSAPTVQVALPDQPGRDPFVISDAHFPPLAPLSQLPGEEPKSDPNAVEDPEQVRLRLRARLQELTEQLTLEAVMTGGGLVVVNGRMHRVGDQISIEGHDNVRFELVRVLPRSIIVSAEEFRFRVSMDAPRG